ncbi:UNVERIFIED_ORG: hypothetical protein BDU10_9922 [Burkholderia sp. CF145]|uniref:hypothetical protein n=1 Tax=Paraburkholderia hospita TaxID=169430 RepID=UPI0002718222|nr:hypothetical protein [Paraburkholderia hospita]EUC12629.1 hypothetical protein PMI06_008571 [Burkholderia sp. BT03]SKC49626.1 hypothetical protein SAMN06266956_0294 [Paraburkholderia hospita]SKD05702.1 hypothetical protein SAMN05445504_9573 [Burkholderia sp. CF099]
MKYTIAAIISVYLALLCPSAVRAQESSRAGPSAASEHPDEIVRMHQQVAAADREYNREVTAAKKVYDHKKAEAKKKRDVAVAAAHSGTTR